MSKVKSYSLEELSKHHEATLSNVSRYVAERDYIELQQRNAELAAQVEKLRVSATIVLNARDEDGITTSGLLKKFNELSEALSFLPGEYLAEHDREVAARAVGSFIEFYWRNDINFFSLAECGSAFANKIKSGKVEL